MYNIILKKEKEESEDKHKRFNERPKPKVSLK